MEQKLIIVNLLNIICSVLTCIILKPHMFSRSLMHFPIGSLGSYIIYKSKIHGIIFIYLITLYQCLELYGHYKLYNVDYSWIDIEGYIIGFIYTTIMIIYLKEKNKQNTVNFAQTPLECV